MNLQSLLLSLLHLTSPRNGTPNSPPNTITTVPLQPRQGFTDPNLPTQPITFYETASALVISNGKTYTTTYVDLISGTTEFPVTVGSSRGTTTPAAIPKPTTTTSSTSTGRVGSSLITTPSPSTKSSSSITTTTTATTTPTPSTSTSLSTSPSVPPTTTPPLPSSSTSPILDLSPCSTFTGAESLLEGCINSVVGALSLTGGGPIIASTTSTTTTSTTAPATTTSIATTTSTAATKKVTPTTTITMPYLGAVVAKGEATFVVGGGGAVKEGKGGRGRGRGGGWGWLVGWVGGWLGWGVVGLLRL